jgi:hypothetical protein
MDPRLPEAVRAWKSRPYKQGILFAPPWSIARPGAMQKRSTRHANDKRQASRKPNRIVLPHSRQRAGGCATEARQSGQFKQ